MIPPKHVAIIMDGNGRWGIRQKKSRNFGHKKGVLSVEKIINAAIKREIKFLTLYTFSTENWRRPLSEINFLLRLLELYIDKDLENLNRKGVKIVLSLPMLPEIPPRSTVKSPKRFNIDEYGICSAPGTNLIL